MARKDGKDRGLFERPGGSGIWWIHYHDAEGRKHREKVGKKGLARKLYEKRKTEVREARYFPPDRRRPATVDEIIDAYRPARGIEGERSTWGPEYYRRAREHFGGRPAHSVTPAEVETWRDDLARDHAQATVNRHLQFLRAVYLRAVRDGTVASSPTATVKFYRDNNRRERWLRDDEEERLFDALPAWLHPLVTAALNTGMRKSELLALRWADVDSAAGAITIRDPKSGYDEHVVMNETVKLTLRALREARTKVVTLKDRTPDNPSGYVFTAA
jgi:integrase